MSFLDRPDFWEQYRKWALTGFALLGLLAVFLLGLWGILMALMAIFAQ